MAGLASILRSGAWLTVSRMRLWAIAVLIASAAGIVWLAATADGLNDYQGRPLGTDFSNIYVAGSYIVEGRPEAPFDPTTTGRRTVGVRVVRVQTLRSCPRSAA